MKTLQYINITNAFKSTFTLVLLIIVSFGNVSASLPTTGTDEIAYDHDDLSTLIRKNIYIGKNDASYLAICGETVTKAEIFVQLDLDDEFNYGGDNTFETKVKVKLRGVPTGGGAAVTTIFPKWLTIKDGQPVHLFHDEFTADFNNIDFYRVFLLDFQNNNTLVESDIRLKIWIEKKHEIEPLHLTAPLSPMVYTEPVSGSSPVTFSWTASCDYPSYQFQLLRLYNQDAAKVSDETDITATVDWNNALTLETTGNSIALNMAEGQGYYIWRVRPIGNFENGGIANDLNWGVWCNAPAQGSTVSYNDPASLADFVFFFTDPNDNQNWIYQRTFSEESKMKEAATFYNGLLQEKQSQVHLFSEGSLLIGQAVADHIGRPLLQSMSVPVEGSTFAYQPNFLLNSDGENYGPTDFDDETTIGAPNQIIGGPLADYYSDANPDANIPSAGGYPFSRTIQLNDGTGRPMESSSPGTAHAIGAGHTMTFHYANPGNGELLAVFGDETPAESELYKTVTINQDKVSTVDYFSKSGQKLATCISANSDQQLLETLDSEETRTVQDALEGEVQLTWNTHSTSKVLMFTDPTNVTFNYELLIDEMQHDCIDFCTTCDYEVEINIRNVEGIYPTVTPTISIPAADCGSATGNRDTTFSQNLMPGSYVIEKRVTTANHNPASVTEDNVIGNTYLEEHIALLADSLQAQRDTLLDTVFVLLENNDLTTLWEYLDANADEVEPEVSYTLRSECCEVVIPYDACPVMECPETTPPDLEEYFVEILLGHIEVESNRQFLEYGGVNSDLDALKTGLEAGGIFYVSDYQTGQLNTLAFNMLRDEDMPYTCDELWSCWDGVAQMALQSYFSFDPVGGAIDTDWNPVTDWLECTGQYFQGYTTDSWSDETDPDVGHGYLSHAYTYFNYTAGSNPDCEAANDFDPAVLWPMDDTTAFDMWEVQFGDDYNEKYRWKIFYDCLVNYTTEPQLSATQAVNLAEELCLDLCEARRSAFEMEVIATYHDAGLTVAGDDGLISLPDISQNEVDCQVQMLVDHCGAHCDLTIFYTGGNPVYSSHIPTGGIVYGDLYKVVSQDPASACYVIYDGILYGPNSYYGDEFFGGTDPNYTVMGAGCVAGTNIAVLNDVSEIDSMGSRLESNLMRKSMTWAFELELPVAGNCHPDFTPVQAPVPFPSGPELLTNGNFTQHGSTCATLPNSFGGACTDDWQTAFGDPKAIFTNEADHLPRMAGLQSHTEHTGPISVIRGDGIAYESQLYLTAGNHYFLSFDVKVNNDSTADNLYAVLDDFIPTFSGDVLPPRPAANIIYHGKDVSNDQWQEVSVLFEAVSPNPVNFYMYVLQETGSDIAEVNIDNVSIREAVFQTCSKICFRWADPVTPPDDNTIIYSKITCEELVADYLEGLIAAQISDCSNGLLAEFENQYAETCGNASNIEDELSFEYIIGTHHYTLFYYDRAGNLVQTVPPKGVDQDEEHTREVHPAHSHYTQYAYNSLGQKIWAQTPDGGETNYFYDDLNQLRFSQNAQQLIDGKFSYLKYDNLGRVIEAGQSSEPSFESQVDDPAFPSSNVEEWVKTHYTVVSGEDCYGAAQRFVANRISHTETIDGAKTHYSYDPHGNVEWLVTELPGFGKNYVEYEYNLVSGNVTQINYNRKAEDRFFVRYAYDDDNRPLKVETSRNEILWETDASYEYYAHGPMKRQEIGADKLQGLDYVYTIQGWLKGINHPTLDGADDPGADGQNGSITASDVFGMTLGYFDGDFDRSGSAFSSTHSAYMAPDRSLHTGNIATWASRVTDQTGGFEYDNTTANQYVYDALGRLLKSEFHYLDNGWQATDDYKTEFGYDANGNIMSLMRNGYASENLGMDDLTYEYEADNNRLHYIADAVDEDKYDTDLDNQTAGNYEYDAIGNLTRDVEEQIDNIEWNAAGKVKHVDKDIGEMLDFVYDALGNRIKKVSTTNNGADVKTTFYARDASGKTLAVYEEECGTITLKEQPIYATKRVGMISPDEEITPGTAAASTKKYARELGHKQYELTDHLGNVRAVISDEKLADHSDTEPVYTASVMTANNYYPFGSPLVGQQADSDGYRYGFNGMEKDDEMKGEGNSYTTFFRQYDPRVGRWLSLDPKAAKFPFSSPYIAFNNNPTMFIDPKGDESEGHHIIPKELVKKYFKEGSEVYDFFMGATTGNPVGTLESHDGFTEAHRKYNGAVEGLLKEANIEDSDDAAKFLRSVMESQDEAIKGFLDPIFTEIEWKAGPNSVGGYHARGGGKGSAKAMGSRAVTQIYNTSVKSRISIPMAKATEYLVRIYGPKGRFLGLKTAPKSMFNGRSGFATLGAMGSIAGFAVGGLIIFTSEDPWLTTKELAVTGLSEYGITKVLTAGGVELGIALGAGMSLVGIAAATYENDKIYQELKQGNLAPYCERIGIAPPQCK